MWHEATEGPVARWSVQELPMYFTQDGFESRTLCSYMDQGKGSFFAQFLHSATLETNGSTAMRAVLKNCHKAGAHVTKYGSRSDRNSIRVQGLLWFDRGNDVLNGRYRNPRIQ